MNLHSPQASRGSLVLHRCPVARTAVVEDGVDHPDQRAEASVIDGSEQRRQCQGATPAAFRIRMTVPESFFEATPERLHSVDDSGLDQDRLGQPPTPIDSFEGALFAAD